jgi:hypothetical protein
MSIPPFRENRKENFMSRPAAVDVEIVSAKLNAHIL